MSFHSHGAGFIHHGLAGHVAGGAAHGFLAHVGHMIFTALIYETVFRILRHIPLPILIVMAVFAVIVGYRYYRKKDATPFL